MTGFLVLEDGTVFRGESVGAPGFAFGEAVFTTAMTGYQEIVTDPSYAEQLVAFTAPMVGNYGVSPLRSESARPQARAVLMRRATGEDWPRWLQAQGIVALEEVDTRALVVRLREPLWSPIIGAEDPYLNMERAWMLLAGQGTGGYPPGFIALIAPFTLLGADAFYTIARFLPALIGAAAVLAMFLLCRPYMHVGGSLAAAAAVALIPEHVRRSNFLVPTAFDLVLVPLILLMALRASEGRRRALPLLLGLSALLLLAHPLVFLFVGPTVLLFAFITWMRAENGSFRSGALSAATLSVAGLAGVQRAGLPGPNPGEFGYRIVRANRVELLVAGRVGRIGNPSYWAGPPRGLGRALVGR